MIDSLIERYQNIVIGFLSSLLIHVGLFRYWPQKKPKMFNAHRGVRTMEARWVQSPQKSKKDFLPEKQDIILEAEAPETQVKKEQKVETFVPPVKKIPENAVPFPIKDKKNPKKKIKKEKKVEKKVKKKMVEPQKKMEKKKPKPPQKKQKSEKLEQKNKNQLLSSSGSSDKKHLQKDSQTKTQQKLENKQTKKKDEKSIVKPAGNDEPVENGRDGEERVARVCIEVDEKGEVENFVLEELQNCDDLTESQRELLEEWEFDIRLMKGISRHLWVSRVMKQLEALGIEKISFFMDQDENSPFTKIPSKEESMFYASENLTTAPEPIQSVKINPPPRYPLSLQKEGKEGTVRLEVFINRRGEVVKLRVHESSGHSELDTLAMTAVELWAFRPGRLKKSVVNSKMIVPVSFLKSN